MADDQLEWVFDSLVEFLRGPIWNIPVLTFIEQKSVVFEPGAENEEELKKIHEAYKNLVDFMLGSYMEDLRITPEEFEKSCSVASKKALNQFHQSLFQQVWAADDFEIFRRMMTQKNLELQLQALEFLSQKRGSLPDCMEPDGLRTLEQVLEDVRVESPPAAVHVTPADAALQEKMLHEARREKQLLDEAVKQATHKVPQTEEDSSEIPPEDTGEPPRESPDAPGEDGSSPAGDEPDIRLEVPALPVVPKVLPPLRMEERTRPDGESNFYTQMQAAPEVTPVELQKRQDYLRQQRDRLLALKRQERARRLSGDEQAGAQESARPRSARAARQALRGETPEGPDPQEAFRKSLAARLRSEVVDKTD